MMDFEISETGGKVRFIVYQGENGEFSCAYETKHECLKSLMAAAKSAIGGKHCDEKPSGSGTLAVVSSASDRVKPYRLIYYAAPHSDGYKMTKKELSRLVFMLRGRYPEGHDGTA